MPDFHTNNKSTTQERISKSNRRFWDELCGTSFAKSIGVTDASIESLRLFDEWYFKYYPYLDTYVPVNKFAGRSVLEIGLGYGTIGDKIANSNVKQYVGLDISDAPVKMMNYRISQKKVSHKASAIVGNIINAPFHNDSFDIIVSIGCLHHTGNMQCAVDEIYRLLKPSGIAYIMVYNQFSFRQFYKWPMCTIKALYKDIRGDLSKKTVTEFQRRAYDKSSDGIAAPETEFFSIRQLKYILRNFTSTSFTIDNFDNIGPFNCLKREKLLTSWITRKFGLDIYIQAVK
jgi:SAM-dependent methyltransferase